MQTDVEAAVGLKAKMGEGSGGGRGLAGCGRTRPLTPTSGRERDRIVPLCYKSPTEHWCVSRTAYSALSSI
jgi:hypothetical protein